MDLIEPITNDNEFEFVDVPLPACFDLSKPYQSEMKTSSNDSLHVSWVFEFEVFKSFLF